MHRANTLTWAGVWLAALLLLLMGCQTAPATPEEAIGRTYTTITTVAEATIEAHTSGAINDAQARRMWQELQQAVSLTETAQVALAAGESAEDPLRRAQAILQTVVDILEASNHE